MAKIHIHTKYSLLDAIIEPEELVKLVKQQDGDKAALCVTEHGNLYSDVEIYKLCKKYDVKYLMGCEMYICDDVEVKSKDNKYCHLVVIAKNEAGRLNLNKLVSLSTNYKYYGKPRIDFQMLKQYKEGLIVCSACMAGELQRAILENDAKLVRFIVEKYKNEFGDDYYLEFQSHSDETQQKINYVIIKIAKKLGVKFIVTTDAHYLNKEEQKYHNIFVQIGQSRETGETYNDCYVQSDDEIIKNCNNLDKNDVIQALNTTNEIADKCNVELPLSAPIMPHVKIPSKYKSEIDYLKALCIQGWHNKKIDKKPNKDEYKERLAYEMNAIEKMGFEGYFLLVYSYANSVKRRGIARGSAGGSLVCYLSNITDIDPMEYGLYFERFIDVGALDLLEQGEITKNELKIPDIDSDFGRNDRNKVLEFVIEKYGEDKVVSLGSFQYIWAKGAIKDIGKVLNIPFTITNEMTKYIQDESIREVMELGLLDAYKNDYPELFNYAERLAGLPKSFCAHPCGKVVCVNDVTYYNATDISKSGELVLQGDMHTADDLGLIKADFLGLRTVDIIYDTLEMIGKDYEYIAPHNLNFNDDKVYEAFRNGHTAAVFQFESDGMKDTLKKINTNCFDDLIVANALYRPGSIKYIDNYADRKKGIEKYEYINNDLEPILKNTYGIIVYQEQLIEIGRMADLSNPDQLRKATAKKKSELLAKIKPELFNGLRKRGWTNKEMNILWESMLDFAKYSFNKSHSAAYAMIAYICMFLKVYHPKEFLCSCVNSVIGKPEKTSGYIREINKMKIKMYFGKYNDCSSKTTLYKDGVMIGIASIKYCNSTIADELLKLSKNKYSSFFELLDNITEKTSVNTKQLNILTGLNFFSNFGKNKYLLKLIEIYNGVKKKSEGSKSPKIVLPPLRTCSVIKKDKLSDYKEYGLTEYIVKKYAGKETAKQYSQIDNMGLLNELASTIDNKPMSVIEQCKFEKEYLEYVTYVNPNLSEDYYIVADFKTYKDTTKPQLLLRNLKTGNEIKTRIKQARIYKNNPFGEFSILKIEGFTWDYKSKYVDKKWIKLDEKELLLMEYSVIAK